MSVTIDQQIAVPLDLCGKRLDQAASSCFPDFSRAKLQEWIKNGALRVNGNPGKPKEKVMGGETLTLLVEVEEEKRWGAEEIPLDIVYEDQAILVINKPAGLVVHPAAGNYSGTLLNGLLHHCPSLATIPRAGIVHRLDKDTTGLMVVAKTLAAHADLVAQLQERTVCREYEAVVQGVMTVGGSVDAAIGRHPVHRLRMAVVGNGKPSLTHYRVLKKFPAHTHVSLKLETGRTHQIRVHMSHIRFPLVGDDLYAGGFRLPKGCSSELEKGLRAFRRQALHACRLGLIHPVSHEPVEWGTPLPEDFTNLLTMLAEAARQP